eukprot:jgi/Pico_ML_1/53425/g3967.t1
MDAVELLQRRRRRSAGTHEGEKNEVRTQADALEDLELDEEQVELRIALQRLQRDLVHDFETLRNDAVFAERQVVEASMALPLLQKRIQDLSSSVKDERVEWMGKLKPLEKKMDENERTIQRVVQMRDDIVAGQEEMERREEEKLQAKLKHFDAHVDSKVRELQAEVDAGQDESKHAWKVMESGAKEAAAANEDVVARQKWMEELRRKISTLTESKDLLLLNASNLVSTLMQRKVEQCMKSATSEELEEAEHALERLRRSGPRAVEDAVRDELRALETALSETQAEDAQSLRRLRREVEDLRGQIKRMEGRWQNISLYLYPPPEDEELMSPTELRTLTEKMSLLEERVARTSAWKVDSCLSSTTLPTWAGLSGWVV